MTSIPDAKLTSLFQSHYDEVRAYCARRVGPSDADDIAAEVFSTAWRRYDEIDWGTVRPWLYGIARGVISNRWRSNRRKARLVEKMSGFAPPMVETPDVLIVRHEQDVAITNSLRSLKPADQEVLMLAAWEELTAPEIATSLGISTSAAEQRLHRAKRRLEKVVQSTDQGQPITSGDLEGESA